MSNTTISSGHGSGVRNTGFDVGAQTSANGVSNATTGVQESAELENQMERATRNENHNKLTEKFLQKVEQNRLESAKDSIEKMV